MQQKCKMREMSDTIRRNEHTKICMAKLTNLTNRKPNFVNFVKLVMQNFKSDGIRHNGHRKKRMALLALLAL